MEGITFRRVLHLSALFLIILLTFFKCAYSSNDQTISDSLNSLQLENELQQTQTNWINTSFDKPPTLHHHNSFLRENLNQKLSELLRFSSSPESKFVAQHLFQRNDSNGLDSYQYLCQRPENAKRYLVDLNLKLYKGGVLPQLGEFNMWFTEAENGLKTINLLDEKLENLRVNLHANNTTFKKRVNGSQLVFKTVREPNSDNVARLDVIAHKFSAEVDLVPDSNGELSHLKNVKTTNGSLVTYKKVCSLTIMNLEANAKWANDFQNDFKIPPEVAPKSLLNVDSAWFKDKMKKYWKRFEELVIRPTMGMGLEGQGPICYGTSNTNGSTCVIIIRRDNGSVSFIKGEEFYNVFRNGSKEDKHELAKLARDNLDKVILWPKRDGEDKDEMERENKKELEQLKEKITNLIRWEGVTTHVRIVDTVHEVLDYGNVKHVDARQYLNFAGEKLQNLPAKVSSTRIVTSLTVAQSLETNLGANISDRLGSYFNLLSKSIVNGIEQGDRSIFALIGEKMGYNVTFPSEGEDFEGEEWREIEKTANILGQMASQIGAEQDIPLGIFSLIKSIERLRNTKDKFKRNDVIAEIVRESTAVATLSGTVVVSIAFQPESPATVMVAMAMHLINRLAENLHKTGNEEINRTYDVNETKNWNGSERELEYVDYLLEEKKANDLVVQHNLEYLKNNKDYYKGIVFPSSELVSYDGGCNLTRELCLNHNCSLTDPSKTVGTRCDKDMNCADDGSNYNCENFRRNITLENNIISVMWYRFNCTCNKSLTEEDKVKWGVEPKANSVLDFREKRKLFWERSVPGAVKGAEFLCKPGSLGFMGWNVSELGDREEYFCDSAIGIVLPEGERGRGNALLIDLREGDDEVHLNEGDGTPSVFRMGRCGNKSFFGGGGRNEFVFGGNVGEGGRCLKDLEGFLRGGEGEEDGITLLKDFWGGRGIKVDFREGYLKILGDEGEEEGDRILVRFESVEEFVGREGESEVVTVDCSTRKLSLEGGNEKEVDRVIIPGGMGENDTRCNYSLIVRLGEYSVLDSEAMEGEITLLVDSSLNLKEGAGLQASFDIYPGNVTKVNVVFVRMGCRYMVHEEMSLEENMTVTVKSIRGEGKPVGVLFRGKNLTKEELGRDILVHFGEEPRGCPFSEMRISGNKTQRTLVHHLLPPRNPKWRGEGPLERFGSETYRNVFEVSGNDWVAHGGPEKDEFILKARPLGLHGGGVEDGDGFEEDEVWLDEDLNESIFLNLTSANFSGIGRVNGKTRKIFNVTCACDTSSVVVYGGPDKDTPNVVGVPKGQRCGERGMGSPPLKIVARGSSRVEIFGEVEEFKRDGVFIKALSSGEDGKDDIALFFEFEGGSGNLEGVELLLELSHKNWTLKSGRREGGSHVICELVGQGPKYNKREEIRLKFESRLEDAFLMHPSVQMVMKNNESEELPGQVIIQRDTGILRMLYTLKEAEYRKGGNIQIQKANGFWGIPNVFRILRAGVEVTGGRGNDVFVVFVGDNLNDVKLDGGESGDNTLILEATKNVDKMFVVDLKTGVFGYHTKKAGLKGIENVVGLRNRKDHIVTNCDTRTVNGRGGKEGSEDDIRIDDTNCEKAMELTVDTRDGWTKVINGAKRGRFIYNVRDFETTKLTFQVLEENEHLLNFHFDLWTVIKNIYTGRSMDKNGKIETILKLQFKKGAVREFKMASVNKTSGDFQNPIFRFHRPSSPVTSEIRVSNETGTVTATFILDGRSLLKSEQIVGLPVHINRFLIQATSPSDDGVGVGGGVINGSSESNRNQFWIYQLSSPLHCLDGGTRVKCNNCSNNYLHLTPSLLPMDNLEIDLDIEHGSLKRTPKHKNDHSELLLIKQIKNIAEFHGRNHPHSKDTVYVTPHTKKVFQVDQLLIRANLPPNSPSYNLVIIIGKQTNVKFIGGKEKSPLSNYPTNHKFHYKFTHPVSFSLDKIDPSDNQADILMSIASHNYYLPFHLDNLTSINFNSQNKQLSYSVNSTNEIYSHNMISNTWVNQDEFYQQPVMVTQDNFQIRVSRTGSIILSLGATNSSWPSLAHVQSKVIPSFVRRSRQLKVTIMVETRKEFLYIGENASSLKDRNVLENRENLTSHLVGSGGPDTIYDIKYFNKSIYIYSGLEDSEQKCLTIGVDCPYHTIQLADVVMPIRMENGTKFLPTVGQDGNDLVLKIESIPDVNITIVNGALEKISRRFQVVIHSATMRFNSESKGGNTEAPWTLDPTPVVVPRGYVYSVSALDLEDRHQIKLDGRKMSASTSTAARWGNDLYLTDIKGMRFQKFSKGEIVSLKKKEVDREIFEKATTVIITEFFKEVKFKSSKDYKYTDFKESSPYPTGLKGVMVSLPGLNLVLNGNKVLMEVTSEEGEKGGKKGRRKREVGWGWKDKQVFEEVPVVEWKCVLHDVEEDLLKNMPDIPRLYYRSDCVDRFWLIVGIVTGVVFGGMFFICGVVKRKKIREKLRRWRETWGDRAIKGNRQGKKGELVIKAVYDEKGRNYFTKKGIEENVPQFIPEKGDKNTEEFLKLFERWADGRGLNEQQRKRVFWQALPSAAGIAWWSSRSRDISDGDVGWEFFRKDFQESMESLDVTKFGDDGIVTTLKKRWGWSRDEGKFCVLTLNKPKEIGDLVKLVGEKEYEIGREGESDNYGYIDEIDGGDVSKVVNEEEVEKDVKNVQTLSASRKLISIIKRKGSAKEKMEGMENSKGVMVEGAILVKI